MLYRVLLIAVLAFSVGCSTTYHDAVTDPNRLQEARDRDSVRKPQAIMLFAGARPGQTIVEIAPAGGYYTGLLSRVVGPEGQIIAIDPERIFEHFPNGRNGFPEYAKKDPRDNVTYSSQLLDQVKLPTNVDQVWMVLYYHDTVWTGEDRAEMNRRFFEALKPGGTYLVIDHHAKKGAPDSVTRDLHRIDADIVLKEVTAAGFELDEESDVLENDDDPRDDSVFGEERRGNTDRFVWRFTKPD